MIARTRKSSEEVDLLNKWASIMGNFIESRVDYDTGDINIYMCGREDEGIKIKLDDMPDDYQAFFAKYLLEKE